MGNPAGKNDRHRAIGFCKTLHSLARVFAYGTVRTPCPGAPNFLMAQNANLIGFLFRLMNRFPPHRQPPTPAAILYSETRSSSMKTRILSVIASFALLVGCAEMRKHMGGGSDNDHNVLTGGPVTGTTIKDLPQSVKNTLKEKTPNAEIADIDRQSQGGRIIYRITFAEATRNPTMYIAQDGSVVQNLQSEKPAIETEGK
jgi:hypothetical protein